MTEPRVSGTHWWDPDRIAHLADMARFCLNCGGTVTGTEGISVEYGSPTGGSTTPGATPAAGQAT